MKLNLNTSSLNWEKANVFDYRYIYHLMLMINERYTKVGIHEKNTYYPAIPNEYANRQEWNFAKWSPNGILTWDQLQSIYSTTFFLAIILFSYSLKAYLCIRETIFSVSISRPSSSLKYTAVPP